MTNAAAIIQTAMFVFGSLCVCAVFLLAVLYAAFRLDDLIEDWRELRTVLRLLEYRVLSAQLGLHQRLLALQASNPFR